MRRSIVASLSCAIMSLVIAPTAASAQSPEWVQQFGTRQSDTSRAVIATGSGLYVVGQTSGTFGGQASAGGLSDAFVRRLTTEGDVAWTIQFGSGREDVATGVAADATGIYVTGWTNGRLPGSERRGSADAFVSRYEPSGALAWRHQFGTERYDYASGVATDASGVYVVGYTGGVLREHGDHAELDGFVLKYDTGGNVLWTRQFGTNGEDIADGISVKGTDVYVAGQTAGRFPGQPNQGRTSAFVRSLTRNGTTQWTRQFALSIETFAEGVAATRTGVYVAGDTLTTESGAESFVRRYTVAGTLRWTNTFSLASRGGTFTDAIVAGNTDAYVTGAVGNVFTGPVDVFVRAFRDSGTKRWTTRFGTVTGHGAQAWGVAVNEGSVYVAGDVSGAFAGEKPVVQPDAFVARIR